MMTRLPRIDLNCDVGEGAGQDSALMPLITSANIACGAHAGDEATMRAAVVLAMASGVVVGAHPGLPDGQGFGRRERPIAASEVSEIIVSQTRSLQAVARACGTRVMHVKPHGALYTLAARDPTLARAVADAVRCCDPDLALFALAGSHSVAEAEAVGVRAVAEVFADRVYKADGSLTPRHDPGATLEDDQAILAQALQLALTGRVLAADGTPVTLRADTLCLHGDGRRATQAARGIRAAFAQAGIAVRPYTDSEP